MPLQDLQILRLGPTLLHEELSAQNVQESVLTRFPGDADAISIWRLTAEDRVSQPWLHIRTTWAHPRPLTLDSGGRTQVSVFKVPSDSDMHPSL